MGLEDIHFCQEFGLLVTDILIIFIVSLEQSKSRSVSFLK